MIEKRESKRIEHKFNSKPAKTGYKDKSNDTIDEVDDSGLEESHIRPYA